MRKFKANCGSKQNHLSKAINPEQSKGYTILMHRTKIHSMASPNRSRHHNWAIRLPFSTIRLRLSSLLSISLRKVRKMTRRDDSKSEFKTHH